MRVVLISCRLSSDIRVVCVSIPSRDNRSSGPASHDGMARFRCKFGESAMKQDRPIVFPPFRLDPANQRLNCNDRVISLRPKTFGVLLHLAQRARQLVTKDELLDAVWSGVSVSDAVLKGCIREIRDALGDDPAAPRFIETAHRRGYRFIAPVVAAGPPLQHAPVAESRSTVGRETELVRMESWL